MCEKLSKRLCKIEDFSIAWLLIVMSFMALLQVFSRFVIRYSIVWVEEVTRYLMIWLAFIGSASLVSKRGHIQIDIFPEFLSKRTKFPYELVVDAFVLLFSVLFLIYGWQFMMKAYASGQLTPAMRIPKWTMQLSMVIGAALNIVHLVCDTVTRYQKKEG